MSATVRTPLVFYFSLLDWLSPLYRPSLKLGTPVSQEFIDFMFGQVRELCYSYGEVGGLLFDGDWNHDSWAYAETSTRFESAAHILCLLVESVSRGGNYSVRIGPMPSGKVHPEVEARPRHMGQCSKRNGVSIYGADGFRPMYADNVFVTKKGAKVYLHLVDWAPGVGCDTSMIAPDCPMIARSCQWKGVPHEWPRPDPCCPSTP